MQTWKKLSHPNIVKLYDFNIMPIPYLEEELCDSALADIKKPVEPEEGAWILFNICEGLKFAHAQKIVHRDLKPENILIKDGIPKISDWGLSRILTDMTVATSMAFTLTYAAPEQINNGAKDERTDIWQLGVILYELLTGELPFAGGSMMGIRKDITTKDPKLPGEIRPEAQVLDPIVAKCLKKVPSERYSSVIELQKALAQFLQIIYTESLKMSVTAKDYNRSAYYCGDLVIVNLLSGDMKSAYMYLLDLIHYSKGDVKIEAQELSEQILVRMEYGIDEIPDELITKAEIIVHQVSVGFRK
jgi:serine/threonine protein kinase